MKNQNEINDYFISSANFKDLIDFRTAEGAKNAEENGWNSNKIYVFINFNLCDLCVLGG